MAARQLSPGDPLLKKARIRIVLNGTAENPYLGLTANPFPQFAEYSVQAAVMRLQSLGADPIPHDRAEWYIRDRLAGYSVELVELVDLCVSRFRPGQMVRFEVYYDPNS